MNMDYINMGLNEDKLMEECSEVIQAICKAKRFGLDSINPITSLSNRERILAELRDLELAIKNYKEEIQ